MPVAVGPILTILHPRRSLIARETFAKLASQLSRQRLGAAGGGGPGFGGKGPNGFRGFMAGGGLLITLAVGGLAINQSLFNGELCC